MKKLKLKLKPGQIDYTKIRWTPVINCLVKHKDKFLLVQRSQSLNFYPGFWNGISGFLDDKKSLRQKVKEEMKEELCISSRNIKRIKFGIIFDQEEKKYRKTWIVHPALVEIKTDKIKLDWEAVAYKWVSLSEVKKLKLVPGVSRILKEFN